MTLASIARRRDHHRHRGLGRVPQPGRRGTDRLDARAIGAGACRSRRMFRHGRRDQPAARHPARSSWCCARGARRDGGEQCCCCATTASEIPIVQSAAPIRDRVSGDIIGVVLVLHDVSRERQYAAKLSYQASHDSLTGLINRAEFEHRLSLALQSARRWGATTPSCISISTSSRSSTTPAGMPRATSSCARSATLLQRACARATRWRAWAATSSACCWRIARRTMRCASPTSCARR